MAALALGLAGCGGEEAAPRSTSDAGAPTGRTTAAQSLPVPAEFANTALPRGTGEEFLNAFADLPNTSRREDGAVVQVLAKGSGATPGASDLAKVHFVARMAGEPEPLGSSYETGAPVVFAVDQSLAFADALTDMKEGGKVRIALPADLAFGGRGDPEAVSVYDLELLEVYSSDDDAALAELAEDLQASVQEFTREAQRQQALAEQQKTGLDAANRARSVLFIAEQAQRPATVQTPSGLVYEVLDDAGAGETPEIGDMVEVHYRGTLPNGELFDSSYERGEPAKFELGRVIAGWNEGLQLMNPGDTYRLYIPADLGYGPRGTPDGAIPPNSALVFDVELLSIEAQEGDEGTEDAGESGE